MKKWAIPMLILLIFFLLPEVKAEEVPFREGDRIVIFAPEAGMALSSLRSGYTLTAVPVTVEDGAVTGYADTEVWTVTGSDSGWQFSCGGQYLSIASSYGDLALDEVHTLWTVESSGEHFTFLNQGRSLLVCLNSRRNQWSTCTPSAASRSGETELSVYVLPREEPEEEVEDPIYFGQLHSHSTLSDGTASPEELYEQAKAAGLDFFALTDHSHSFDSHKEASLADGDLSRDWVSGQNLAKNATTEDFLGLFAFEITWNQGQGHMNTFFTGGFASREREEYQSWADGMETYIADLPEDSVSQFNHPGPEFGNFKDFSAYSPEADETITLMEISGDLSPYFQALAAGWHLAPTLSGDAHSFDPSARTAVLADSLTGDALREALQNRRVYATTDEDLQIHFTLDGHEMGSILPRADYPRQVTFEIRLTDPTDSQIGLVELLSEGEVLTRQEISEAAGEIAVTLNANRDHYLLRITQPDGDWAVTAPIWLDDRKELGIRALESESEILTPGKSQNFTVELFNHEDSDLILSSLTLCTEGTVYTAEEQILHPLETASVTFSHTFPVDGVYTLTASLSGTLAGQEISQFFSREFVVMPTELVEDVILDRSHGSTDSVDVFLELCAGQDVSVSLPETPVTAADLRDCRLLMIPAPTSDFSEDYLAQAAEFIRSGGSILLCGTAASENTHAARGLNGLLEAIGATGRFREDDARDEINNADSPDRLRATDFAVSLWTEAFTEGQFFAQNRGCTIDPGAGQWLVRSVPGDVLLSAEDTPYGGTVFLSGGNLLSDDTLARPSQPDYALPYANQTFLETVLGLTRHPQQIIPIDRLRQAESGRVYLAEGRITAGTANPHTTFPDSVYLQDHTGGIQATGYSQHGLAPGTRVRILGELVAGENPTFRVLRLTELGRDTPVQPQSGSIPGSLLTVEGQVSDVMGDGTAVSRFRLGDTVVIVEDCIRSGSRGVNELARLVTDGNTLRAVGLGHLQQGRLVLRLRDCDEVWLLSGQTVPLPTQPEEDVPSETEPEDPDDPDPTDPSDPDSPGTGDPADPEDDNPPTGDKVWIFVLLLLGSGWCLHCWKRFPRSS